MIHKRFSTFFPESSCSSRMWETTSKCRNSNRHWLGSAWTVVTAIASRGVFPDDVFTTHAAAVKVMWLVVCQCSRSFWTSPGSF